MGYTSLKVWRDLTDGHLYHEGEPFPFDGREISSERLTELETGRNRAGLPLILATDVRKEQRQVEKQEAPEVASEGLETVEEKPRPRRTKTKK